MMASLMMITEIFIWIATGGWKSMNAEFKVKAIQIEDNFWAGTGIVRSSACNVGAIPLEQLVRQIESQPFPLWANSSQIQLEKPPDVL